MQANISIKGKEVNWARAELIVKETRIPLEPKLLQVLACLVRAEGAIVSQQTLLDQVWGETLVSPNTIQKSIAQLRKLFDDDAKRQDVIQTHPKLGYSLLPSAVTPPDANAVPKLTLLQKLAVLAIGLTTLALLFVLNRPGKSLPKAPEIEALKPVTVHGENVSAFAAPSPHYAYFVDKEAQRLIRQEDDGQQRILVDKVKIYGAISLNLNQSRLYYGEQTLIGKKKCVSLVELDLSTTARQTLLPCDDLSYHSAIAIDDNSLLLTGSSITSGNQLFRLELGSKQLEKVEFNPKPTELLSPLQMDFDSDIGRLILTFKNSLGVYKPTPDWRSLELTAHHALPDAKGKTITARWYRNSRFLVAYGQTLAWFDGSGLIASNALLTGADIMDVQVGSDGQLLARFSHLDWDVRVRDLNSGQDWDIGQSRFVEKDAQFRPGSTDIAFISSRSGQDRLYLQNSQEVRPVSQEGKQVDAFIWNSDGERLYYLSDEQLWLTQLGQADMQLKTPFAVNGLFQAQDQQLLLSAKTESGPALIWYEPRARNYQVLLPQAVKWAQRIDGETFITNTDAGQLRLYKAGKLATIKGLPELTIQSHYLWRADATGHWHIYVQDKRLNIWRYDPAKDKGEVIGQYDANALFMTDMAPVTSQMLSDNFVSQANDLYRLTIR